ncbi:glucokinase [Terriglobus roseus DSM 18391]|uniref:Glucokinase n=1 Tax=Terriglobus roseus (strain DSM 18391 / NRRL B-41598 / KBS 63) TaxID=926566 RepID=I3ZDK3_TERRK|nr:glucokinase [Terriglobus roseus]AFL87321.1 glucokinase [Terriglobus roseus DSM 18391]
MILAGDVGGTKVDLALYSFDGGKLTVVRTKKFPASGYASLQDVVLEFLKDPDVERKVEEQVVAACFGCPGPVKDGHLKLTNLPWELDSRDLSKILDIEHIFLINDLEANGYGIAELGPEQVFELEPGDKSAIGHRALVSAGTGLGEALLVWNAAARRHVPLASEGGHVDWAPRNPLEIEMLIWLQAKLKGRVSSERVVSGLGLKNIYEFLRDGKKMEEPAWLRERLETEDPNFVIGTTGEDGSCELTAKVLEMFTAAYGAECGNMGLKLLAAGGVYLGGGIPPKILKTLKSGPFRQAFLDKGRLSPLLHTIPVRVILEEKCALIGAAAYAEARAAELSGHSERAASTP